MPILTRVTPAEKSSTTKPAMIMACPKDKGPLLYFSDEDSLYNPRLRLRYPITDNIPVMLIDESTVVDDAEHDRLMAIVERDSIRPTFDAG